MIAFNLEKDRGNNSLSTSFIDAKGIGALPSLE
jgi:hypothetical protein